MLWENRQNIFKRIQVYILNLRNSNYQLNFGTNIIGGTVPSMQCDAICMI